MNLNAQTSHPTSLGVHLNSTPPFGFGYSSTSPTLTQLKEDCGDARISNIVFLGEIGVGKSVINLIAGQKIARTSSETLGCPFEHQRHVVTLDGTSCALWDTTGLDEGSEGIVPTAEAESNLCSLIQGLTSTGGINLVVYCIRPGGLTKALQHNYDLFYVVVCRKKVPVALVITGLEHQEGELETWWDDNEEVLRRSEMWFDAHECVATLDAKDNPVQQRRSDFQRRLRELVVTYSKFSAWKPEPPYISWVLPMFRNVFRRKFSGGGTEKSWSTRRVVTWDIDDGVTSTITGPSTLAKTKGGTRREEAHSAKRHSTTAKVTIVSNVPFASGGYANIYSGKLNAGTLIDVVIKKYREHVNNDSLPDQKERLMNELSVWLNLEHPNILLLLGVVTLDSNTCLPALVSPLAENGALTAYLDRNKRLTILQRLVLIDGVARGLQYVHSQHVVHGGLSGSNILVHADGRACISGFGSAIALAESEGPRSVGRQVEFDARWAAPELFPLDDLHVVPSMQSDVYSFGSVMLQILTGNVPYPYLHWWQVMLTVMKGHKHKRPDQQTFVTDDRWNFMEWCWSTVDARPSSERIVEFTNKELATITTTAQ